MESNANGQNEIECEEDFVVDQIYALFEFNQASGSTKRYIERTTPRQKTDPSQHGIHMRERNQKNPSLETFTLSVSVNSYEPKSNKLPKSRVDKVNGIETSFSVKKRGHSPEAYRLWLGRNQITKPQRVRIVGKRKDNERIQEYRSSQQGLKQILELNIQIYNQFSTLSIARHWERHLHGNSDKIITNLGSTTSPTEKIKQVTNASKNSLPEA